MDELSKHEPGSMETETPPLDEPLITEFARSLYNDRYRGKLSYETLLSMLTETYVQLRFPKNAIATKEEIKQIRDAIDKKFLDFAKNDSFHTD